MQLAPSDHNSAAQPIRRAQSSSCCAKFAHATFQTINKLTEALAKARKAKAPVVVAKLCRLSRQFEANRRNARKSTGPTTEEGKQRSRCNAVRHGLTAETVIGALEDAEDYKAFEAAITADYDAQSAVERDLTFRLTI